MFPIMSDAVRFAVRQGTAVIRWFATLFDLPLNGELYQVIWTSPVTLVALLMFLVDSIRFVFRHPCHSLLAFRVVGASSVSRTPLGLPFMMRGLENEQLRFGL